MRKVFIEPLAIPLFASEEHRCFDMRMSQQQPREFKTRVARRADDRCLQFRHCNIPLKRVANLCAFFFDCEITRIVSSPPTVPTISLQPSASMAAATGCAEPGA